jgi:hypothetical protein
MVKWVRTYCLTDDSNVWYEDSAIPSWFVRGGNGKEEETITREDSSVDAYKQVKELGNDTKSTCQCEEPQSMRIDKICLLRERGLCYISRLGHKHLENAENVFWAETPRRPEGAIEHHDQPNYQTGAGLSLDCSIC